MSEVQTLRQAPKGESSDYWPDFFQGELEEAQKEGKAQKARMAETSLGILGIIGELDLEDYNCSIHGGFFQAIGIEKKNKGEKEKPPFGLKIHIALEWDDPFFLEVAEAVKDICSAGDQDGQVTTFKIMTPNYQNGQRESMQGKKSITIYPNYLRTGEGFAETNVAETLRLVQTISEVTAKYPSLKERSINNELEVGPAIFIRPAPFTKEGNRFTTSDPNLNFEEQLEVMANSDHFRQELVEAGILAASPVSEHKREN